MPFVAGYPTSDRATSLAAVRRDLEGLVVRDAAGKMRAGVFPSHTGDLFVKRADMRLDILDFAAVQDKKGACFIRNEGATQSPAFAAAPTANKRIDVLYVTQEIDAIDGGTTRIEARIVTGTPSPTPTRPSLPAGDADAIPLFAVEIPAGATSMQSAGVIVTPIFPYTATAGAPVTVRSVAELDAWKPADGAKAYCLGDTSEYVRAGGEWEGGWVDVPYTSGHIAPANRRLQARYTASGVQLRGAVQRTSGNFATGTYIPVATLPKPLYRPAVTAYSALAAAANTFCSVSSEGVIQIFSSGTPGWVDFGGATW